ncbi:Abi family protein [Tenacibaculum retecalamus]|uniref:Abi family protein n=1 Tax=Tenacibaculum retecalamus TaxID=3018315 RepID=UPI0023D9306A|nr:Abi family protein [Tenacibaculum retecalamus]WBX70349.1 Abi family protein [Tenacibaculum retecalamus]
MRRTPYDKPSLSYQQQIDLLRQRGMEINNPEKTLHLLSHLSYYRLSGYWHTLLKEPKSEHKFKESTTFEQAFKLYCFDRELRLLLTNQIEKIEVSIRAILTYQSSIEFGTFWLSDSNNFNSSVNRRTGNKRYNETIDRIRGEINRSKENFVTDYKEKYIETLPPSWITLEVCSFGNLSTIYSLLKNGHIKRKIAQEFKLPDSVFQTWLHSLVYVRNICAHHSRLWNKSLKIQPISPRRPREPWIQNFNTIDTRTGDKVDVKDKVYYTISMIQYLLNTINPNNTFKEKLSALFEKYPTIDKKAMGYTDTWNEEPLWK